MNYGEQFSAKVRIKRERLIFYLPFRSAKRLALWK